jgi:hypothetical protein
VNQPEAAVLDQGDRHDHGDRPVNLTAEQAARILGGWSSRSIYRYGAYLGAKRFGRSVRFDRETVLRVAREGLPPDARPASTIPGIVRPMGAVR